MLWKSVALLNGLCSCAGYFLCVCVCVYMCLWKFSSSSAVDIGTYGHLVIAHHIKKKKKGKNQCHNKDHRKASPTKLGVLVCLLFISWKKTHWFMPWRWWWWWGNLLLLLSLLSLPQDELQGECPFISVVAVVCSQSFSLHYQTFWQCEVAVSHSNVMWADNWDISGNCWWSWLMLQRQE